MDVIVHITNNRVIQVVGVSLTSAEKSCQYLIDVISEVLSTVNQLSPKLAADSYIVHPPPIAVMYENITTLLSQELFPVADIQNSIEDGAEFTLSLKGSKSYRSTKALVSDLFGGHAPSLEDMKRINWTQLEANRPQPLTGPNQPEPSQPDVLSQTAYSEFIMCSLPCYISLLLFMIVPACHASLFIITCTSCLYPLQLVRDTSSSSEPTSEESQQERGGQCWKVLDWIQRQLKHVMVAILWTKKRQYKLDSTNGWRVTMVTILPGGHFLMPWCMLVLDISTARDSGKSSTSH